MRVKEFPMKNKKFIIYAVTVSVLFTSLWGCGKKEEEAMDKEEEFIEQPEPQLDIPLQADEELPNTEDKLQKQIDEVRQTFISMQEVCKANDIDRYLDFWDYETKMAVEKNVREQSLEERRENQRKSLTEDPAVLQEIANAKIVSIAVDTSQAQKVGNFFGVDIEGTMMLVRTDNRAYLFHETDKGWKLFTIAPPEYFQE